MKYLTPLAALCFVPMANAANILVTPNAVDDTVNNNCSLVEAIKAVNTRQAVDACPAGNLNDDTILIPAGDYVFTAAQSNGAALPTIAAPMVKIRGTGQKSWNTTIRRSDAEGTPDFRLINIGATNVVTIENLHFKNGRVQGNGAAIHHSRSSLPYNTASLLYVKDSTFTQNDAIHQSYENHYRTILNTDYSHAAGFGGAIYTEGFLNVTKSTFDQNYASLGSGAVYIKTNEVSGRSVIQNNTFYHNKTLYPQDQFFYSEPWHPPLVFIIGGRFRFG